MNRLFAKGLILLLLAGLVITPLISKAQIVIGNNISEVNYERPVEYIVGGVEITGIEYLDPNVIKMLSGIEEGETIMIPGDQITAAIRKLWEQGLFELIKISASRVEGNKIFLIINLTERPRVSKFSFTGIKKSEADDIREKINLSRGDVVTDHLMMKTRKIIKDFYAEKGFLNAEVRIKELPDKQIDNFEELSIEIKKNARVKIAYINILGNSALSDESIQAAMKETKEKGYLNPLDSLGPLTINLVRDAATLKFSKFRDDFLNYWLENYKVKIFKGSKFIEKNYKEDLGKIIAKYNKQGYRDAHIIVDSIYPVSDKDIAIDITIEEGNRYYFRNITWVGNTVYSSALLSSVLGILKGDVYNKELLETNLQFSQSGLDVSSLYMNYGYLFFNATPVETYVNNDSIDLEIRIYEGKQARIKKVSVKGNEKTNDHVIIRELRTRPGQLFSREDIIRTTRELAALRYFNAETISPNIQPNPSDGTVDIEYEVEETSADQIELSGGWGYNRIIGTIGLSFNNFSLRNILNLSSYRPVPSGDGQKLALRFQTYGKDYMNWSIQFTEPWLGGKKPNALSVSYYYSVQSNGAPKNDPARSSFKTHAITAGIGRRLTWPDDYFTLYTGISLQFYILENYAKVFPVGDGSGRYNNLAFNIVLERNSTDAPIFPRKGSSNTIGLSFTPPYSLFREQESFTAENETLKYKWIEYYKVDFKTSWYFELTQKLVLSPRFRFGYLGAYNAMQGVTPFERFYLGGDGLSGGYNYDGREIIGMRGYENESITPNVGGVKVGGTVFTRYTLEVRYPLSLNPSSTIFALAFVEAGNNWLAGTDFDPFELYRSAGLGIRVFLPMFGMLGLDWAYGFDEVLGYPSANGSQFHFSLNQSLD
jgi:outer membrane protein insertion porin family